MEYNIYIDSEIGFGACAADYVRQQVEALKGQPCNVYISSVGGMLSDGLQIYQAFKDHGNVTVTFFGICASAATVLAMGAKKIQMSKNAVIMIHRCSIGNYMNTNLNSEGISKAINELQNSKEMLDRLDEIMANIYAKRAKGDKEDFAARMVREDWFTASEALEVGLVDAIVEEGEQPEMTASMKRQILACGYPLPHLQPKAADKPTFMERLREGLTTLGLLPAKKEEDATSQNSTTAAAAAKNSHNTMNKTFTSIMACLAVEGLAQAEDGSITMSAEQMQAVEAALAAANKKAEDATAQLAERDQKITALNEQVQNLLNDDEGDPADGVPAPATGEAASLDVVSQMSNLLRGI